MLQNVISEYQKIYVQHQFERVALFECLSKLALVQNVIYLGSSIHIAPSYVFRSVMYVDQSERAQNFFISRTEILDWVNQHKFYKASPRIEFVCTDYQQVPIDMQNRYDLVIALNAPGSHLCVADYAYKNSLILYLPLNPANDKLALNPQLKQLGGIYFKSGKYHFESDVSKIPKVLKANPKQIFTENNIYQVFQKQ